jgi:hypothetical protein
MEPRVIRAKWETDFRHEVIIQAFALAAGPAPRALHACKESREEAKRKYCLVRSHLPFTDQIKARLSDSAKSIWLNFDIDTLYFVNIPAMPSFLSYLRRLSKKRIGGADRNIKYIAIHACVLDRLLVPRPGIPSKLLYFYRLVVDVPSIQQIIIMLDNSKFEDDKRPENYSLSRPYSLPKNSQGGGRWGSKKVRDRMSLMFDNFFTKPQGEGMDIEGFEKYRRDNLEWILPSFAMLSITKTPKHDYAGDGLPVDKIPKKRATPKPKTVNAGPTSTKTSAPKVQASKSR